MGASQSHPNAAIPNGVVSTSDQDSPAGASSDSDHPIGCSIGHNPSNSDQNFGHEDDDFLIAVNTEIFNPSFIGSVGPTVSERNELRSPKIRPEHVGAFLGTTLDTNLMDREISDSQRQRTIRSVLQDVASLAESQESSPFNHLLKQRLVKLREIQAALDRFMLKEELERYEKEKAAKQKLAQSEFASSPCTKLGFNALVQVILLLIRMTEKRDNTILHRILDLTDNLLKEFPIFSLVSGPHLSADIAESFKPLVEFVTELASFSSTCQDRDENIRPKALKVLLTLALARGSVPQLLNIAKLLVQTHVGRRISGIDSRSEEHSIAPLLKAVMEIKCSNEINKNETAAGEDGQIKKEEANRILDEMHTILEPFMRMDEAERNSKWTGPVAALLILNEIDRFGKEFGPPKSTVDDTELAFSGETSVVLYHPLGVEVSDYTLQTLSELLAEFNRQIFSTSKKSEEISLYAAGVHKILKIVKVHLFQYNKSGLSLDDYRMSSLLPVTLREHVLECLKRSLSVNDSERGATCSKHMQAIRNEAANVFAEGFDFFCPSPNEQLMYLIELFAENSQSRVNSSDSSWSEHRLLNPLIERLGSFREISNRVSQVITSSDDDASAIIFVERVFVTLISVCKRESANDIAGQKSNNLVRGDDQGLIALLQNLQKHILVEAARRQSSKRSLYVLLLTSFTKILFSACCELIDAAIEALKSCNAEDRLDFASSISSLLESSIVGQVARTLLTALCIYSANEDFEFVVMLVSSYSALNRRFDQICGVLDAESLLNQRIVTRAKETFSSTHPIRQGIRRQQVIYVEGATRGMRLHFDRRCSTLGEQDYVQILESAPPRDDAVTAHDLNPITERFFGDSIGAASGAGHWPSMTVSVDSSTAILCVHTENDASFGSKRAWGYKIVAEATVKKCPFDWIADFGKTSAWLLGLVGKRLVIGSPCSVQEVASAAWLNSELFRGGIEAVHPSFPCISPYALNIIAEDIPDADARRDEVETTFLNSLVNGRGQGDQLFRAMSSLQQDRHRIPKAVEDKAEELLRLMYAVMLHHSNRTRQAMDAVVQLNDARIDGFMHMPDVLKRMWKCSCRINASICELYFQHGGSSKFDESFHIIRQRLSLLLLLRPGNMIKPISPRKHKTRSPGDSSRTALVLHSTRAALSRLKELMQIRSRIMKGKKSPESLLAASISKFASPVDNKESGSVDEIVRAIVAQRTRAALRIVGIGLFKTAVQSSRSDFFIETYAHMSSALHEMSKAGTSSSVSIANQTILLNIYSAGIEFHLTLLENFRVLIERLQRRTDLNEASLIYLLHTLSVHLHDHHGQKIGVLEITEFLRPLLPPVASVVCDTRLKPNIKVSYAAWCAFRVLAYSAPLLGPSRLMTSLSDLIKRQLEFLARRQDFDLSQQAKLRTSEGDRYSTRSIVEPSVWDRSRVKEVAFSGPSASLPLTVTNLGDENSWQAVKSSRVFRIRKLHRVHIKIESIGPSTNSWGVLVGLVHANDFRVDNPMSRCIGGSQGGWAYIAGTGEKYRFAKHETYGESFGDGDIITVELDLSTGEVEFKKNGVSQGVAFNDVSSPVSVAVSFTGASTRLSIVAAEDNESDSEVDQISSPQTSVLPSVETIESPATRLSAQKKNKAKSWDLRLQYSHLTNASIDFFRLSDRNYGTYSLCGNHDGANEFMRNQYLWVLLRCLSSPYFCRIVRSDPLWTNILLHCAINSSETGHILSMRALRTILPKLTVDEFISRDPGASMLEKLFEMIALPVIFQGKGDDAQRSSRRHIDIVKASESVSLVRLLISEPGWKEQICSMIEEGLAYSRDCARLVDCAFDRTTRSQMRSIDRPRDVSDALTKLGRLAAAFAILGGNIEIPREGGRCILKNDSAAVTILHLSASRGSAVIQRPQGTTESISAQALLSAVYPSEVKPPLNCLENIGSLVVAIGSIVQETAPVHFYGRLPEVALAHLQAMALKIVVYACQHDTGVASALFDKSRFLKSIADLASGNLRRPSNKISLQSVYLQEQLSMQLFRVLNDRYFREIVSADSHSVTAGDNLTLRFEWVHDLDENGILFWLGSKQNSCIWINPCTGSAINLTASSITSETNENFLPIISSRRRGSFSTDEDGHFGWICVDFAHIKVRPSAYTIRHWSKSNNAALRSWVIEGSTDSRVWSTLQEQVSTASIFKSNQAHTWQLESQPRTFHRYIRLRMTNVNSSGGKNLVLGGFELYGDVQQGIYELEGYSDGGSPTNSNIPVKRKAEAYEAGSEPGALFSFGKGDSGRLGHNSTGAISTPVALPSLSTVPISQVSSFGSHAILLTSDGKVYTFGNGDHGRLGHGDRNQQREPKLVDALRTIVCQQVVCANAFSMALDCDGLVWAWGQGTNGQMGDGESNDRLLPARVLGELESRRAIVIGAGGYHAFATVSTGECFSWGKNQYGQLGVNSTTLKKVPTKVCMPSGVSRFIQICGGWDHTLALTPEGKLYTWGGGYELRRPVCGHGNNDKQLVPKLVEGLKEVLIVQIASGWDHSLALSRNGEVYCWGGNNGGSLGNGQASVHEFVPKRVIKGLENERVVWVDGGQDHSCCITEKGALWTWGSGGTHLGHQDSSARCIPTMVESARNQLFQVVVCGQKCNFLLSATRPPRPLSRPGIPGREAASSPELAPYPRSAYLVGRLENMVKDSSAQDICGGMAATLAGTYSTSDAHADALSVKTDFEMRIPIEEFACNMTWTLSIKPVEYEACVDTPAVLLSVHDHAGEGIRIVLSADRKLVRLLVADSAGLIMENDLDKDQPLQVDEWHTFTVIKRDGVVVLYIDEVVAIAVNVTSSKMEWDRILCGPTGCALVCRSFCGSLKSVSSWAFALSQYQISRIVSEGLDFVEKDTIDDALHREHVRLYDFTTGTIPQAVSVNGNARFETQSIQRSEVFHGHKDGDTQLKFLMLDSSTSLTIKREVGKVDPSSRSRMLEYTIVFDMFVQSLPHDRMAIFKATSTSDHFADLWLDSRGRVGALNFVTGPIVVVAGKAIRVAICAKLDDPVHGLKVYLDSSECFSLQVPQTLSDHKLAIASSFSLFPDADPKSSRTFVGISALQLRDYYLDEAAVAALGSFDNAVLGDGRTLDQVASTLLHMGYPPRWCNRALELNRMNRSAAFSWMVNNTELLNNEDNEIHLQCAAKQLGRMGYDHETCAFALSISKQNLGKAIHWLLQNQPVASVTGPRSQILAANASECDSSYYIQMSIGSQKENLSESQLGPSAWNSFWPLNPLEDLNKSSSVIIEQLILTEKALVSTYAGRCMNSFLEYWPRDHRLHVLKLQDHNLFISLLSVIRVAPSDVSSLENLAAYVKNVAAIERSVFNSQDHVEKNEFASIAPLTYCMVVEFIRQMCLLLNHNLDSRLIRHQGPPALPLHLVGWMARLLIDIAATPPESRSSYEEHVLCPQIVNIMFEIAVSHNCESSIRVQFVRLLRRIVQASFHLTATQSSHLVQLIEKCKILASCDETHRSFPATSHSYVSPYLQALVELHVCSSLTLPSNALSEGSSLIFGRQQKTTASGAEMLYWSSECAGLGLKLDGGSDSNQHTVVKKLHSSGGWEHALCSAGLQTGIYRVHIMLDQISSNVAGRHLGVGVANSLPSADGCVGSRHGISICNTGEILHQNITLKITAPLSIGDIVTVEINPRGETVSFYTNESKCGVFEWNFFSQPVYLITSMNHPCSIKLLNVSCIDEDDSMAFNELETTDSQSSSLVPSGFTRTQQALFWDMSDCSIDFDFQGTIVEKVGRGDVFTTVVTNPLLVSSTKTELDVNFHVEKITNSSSSLQQVSGIVIGIVPISFAAKHSDDIIIGSVQGGWGIISSSGQKIFFDAATDSTIAACYGEPFGSGDKIRIRFNFESLSITFFKNGVSMGVAFQDVDLSAVKIAVSMSGEGSRVVLVNETSTKRIRSTSAEYDEFRGKRHASGDTPCLEDQLLSNLISIHKFMLASSSSVRYPSILLEQFWAEWSSTATRPEIQRLRRNEAIVSLVDRICERQSTTFLELAKRKLQLTGDDMINLNLENVDTSSIQLRFIALKWVNTAIHQFLPFFNFNVPDDESCLAAELRRNRHLIFKSIKDTLWKAAIESSAVTGPSNTVLVLDQVRAVLMGDSESGVDNVSKTIFGQAFHQLGKENPSIFRVAPSNRAFKAVFRGFYSDDFGGPYRAALSMMCQDLMSSAVPLFVLCSNGREEIGLNRDKFVPRTNATSPLHLALYEFVGKLMGLALRTHEYLDLNLSSIVWKMLVEQEVEEDDVIAVDLLSLRILDEISQLEKNSDMSPAMFSDQINQRFIVHGNDGVEYSIVPDGANRLVTWENRREFADAVILFRKKEFEKQCKAISRGLAEVVPSRLVSLFTWRELEVQVCGSPRIDLDLLQRMTIYESCSSSDSHVQLFWKMVRSRFNNDDLAKLLRFMWGRSRLPSSSKDFDRKFKIQRHYSSDHAPDSYYPVAHTCFFSLELPRYSSLDVMHEKFIYAITHCVAIDADSTAAARNAANRLITEDYQEGGEISNENLFGDFEDFIDIGDDEEANEDDADNSDHTVSESADIDDS